MKNLVLLSYLLVLTGCLVDDQRIIPSEFRGEIDPQVKISVDQALSNNNHHKVIIGILDSGVDYNHPQLQNNVHFEVSGNQITGFGYDFTANDNFASPYLAHTAHLTSKSSDSDQKDAALNIENKKEFANRYNINFSFMRDYYKEIDTTASHGTHVANIASRSNKNIGIKGYRVLPFSENWSNAPAQADFDILIKAIQKAIDDGVNIINMSLGVTTEKGKRAYRKYVKFIPNLKNIMNSNPEVIFVIASGNDGQWVDGDTRHSLPCSLPNISNLICVGSINNTGSLSSYTNITFNVKNLIYAPGKDIIAAIPSLQCDYGYSAFKDEDPVKRDKTFSGLIKKFNNCAKNPDKTKKMSGTSMSTPFISRKVAEIWIKDKSLRAQEVIEKLFNNAQSKKLPQYIYKYYTK